MAIKNINPIIVQKQPTQAGVWIWFQGSPPPSSKQIRGNTTDLHTSTTLSVSSTDNNSVDQTVNLTALKIGDEIRLELSTDSLQWSKFTVVANSGDLGGYFTLSVAPVAFNGASPSNNALLVATATPTAAALGHMILDLTMTSGIDQQIVTDLMDYLCDYLQTVTHLVNHADIQANVGGVIITESEDIVPVVVGPPAPIPVEVA